MNISVQSMTTTAFRNFERKHSGRVVRTSSLLGQRIRNFNDLYNTFSHLCTVTET